MPNAEGRMEEAQLADMIGRLTRSVQSGRSVLFSVGRYEMEQLLAALAARLAAQDDRLAQFEALAERAHRVCHVDTLDTDGDNASRITQDLAALRREGR